MTPILRLACAAVLFLGATGCVVDSSPLLLNNVLAFNDSCTFEDPDTAFDSRGSLNTAFSTTYVRYVELEAQTSQVEQEGNVSGNDIIVTEVQLDYSSTPDLGLQPEKYSVYFLVRASGGKAYPVTDFFPSNASETLKGAVVPGDNILVKVGVRFAGRYRSGGNVLSNRIEYPITLTNAPITCPTGTTLVVEGCGSPGADGTTATCQ